MTYMGTGRLGVIYSVYFSCCARLAYIKERESMGRISRVLAIRQLACTSVLNCSALSTNCYPLHVDLVRLDCAIF